MKNCTFLFFLLFSSHLLFAQYWETIDESKVRGLFQKGSKLYSAGYDIESSTSFFGISLDNGASWTKKSLNEYLNINGTPLCIGFFDDLVGFIGVKGSFTSEILKTTDGGNSWTSVYYNDIINHTFKSSILLESQFMQPLEINVFNEEIAIFNDFEGGRQLRTTDKGENWIFEDVFSYAYLPKMRILNENIAFFRDEHFVYKTTDSGVSWEPVFTGSEFNSFIYSYDFLDENNGFVHAHSDENTKYFKTSDGGANWTELNTIENDKIYIGGVVFSDVNTGWNILGKEIYRSIDGGVNWEKYQTLDFEPFKLKRIGNEIYAIGRGLARLDPNASSVLALDETNSANEVSIFPNPVLDKIYINNPLFNYFEVYNLSGKTLTKGAIKNNYIDLSELKNGLYFLNLKSNKFGEVQRKKIIKSN